MLFDFLTELHWQDFLDISILTIIVYRIILMIQGTRTIQILTGLSLVALVYYISSELNLKGVSWLFTNLVNSLVLVIIVIFQSDFRNALAQVGKTSFLRNSKYQNQDQNILQIVIDACKHFTSCKMGALIVFEQEVGLKNYASSATLLNAKPSLPLLVSIFTPSSPLHDGAIIIDKYHKLQYAGCILPLTSRIDLTGNTGTRHRAAIGLSEETDAVVLVISEEIGAISIAYQGKIENMTSIQSLKNKLENLLFTSKKTNSSSLWEKIVSLLNPRVDKQKS